MTPDHVLVLAWLLLAHLVADFLLQTDGVVAAKFEGGRRGWNALLVHGAGVGVCLVPFVVAYGAPGLSLLVVVTVGHVLTDWWKAGATRAVQARADRVRSAGPADAGDAAPEALGPAWTPVPALLFVLDQLFHGVLMGAAWLLFIARTEPTAEWMRLVDGALGRVGPDDLHAVSLVVAVGASLLIVNVRAAAFFVGTLVGPRGPVNGAVATLEPPPREPDLPATWRVRVGPLEATAEPARTPDPVGPTSSAPTVVMRASPARIGATIGVLERLLIVTFVLSGAVAAIGFVVAAKTLARFKQLDDRDFAEYYLLGTLASVAVGLGSALLAQAALATLAA